MRETVYSEVNNHLKDERININLVLTSVFKLLMIKFYIY